MTIHVSSENKKHYLQKVGVMLANLRLIILLILNLLNYFGSHMLVLSGEQLVVYLENM